MSFIRKECMWDTDISDSFGVEPAYPFGYGKSYTDFDIAVAETALDGEVFSVRSFVVYNTGSEYAGKQVVQAYVSSPEGSLDKPFQDLAAFAKTDTLIPDRLRQLNSRSECQILPCSKRAAAGKFSNPESTLSESVKIVLIPL